MSWEIKGQVANSADVDDLVANPTEAPDDHEHEQVDAVASAVKSLLDAGVVLGDHADEAVYVRAGGHANPGGGPVEGAANEMVTLTIDWHPLVPVEADPVAAEVDAGGADTAPSADASAQGSDADLPLTQLGDHPGESGG